MLSFDVIVVGAGHAGCEAALIAAKLGGRVAVVTLDARRIGGLSCNPAVVVTSEASASMIVTAGSPLGSRAPRRRAAITAG